MTNYSYAKKLNIPFTQAVAKIITTFKEKGFGVLTDVDVTKTLKEKLNVDFKNYRILGMCNPSRAYTALQAEEEIGLLLPCNVIVYEKEDSVVVSAILPTVAFSAVNNKELEPLAIEVEETLKNTIDNL